MHQGKDGLRLGRRAVVAAVHMRPNRVDPHQVHLNPGRVRRVAQRPDRVAGAAVGADDALLLGLGERVHRSRIFLRPAVLGQAVHHEYVDVIGVQFFPKAVDVGPHAGGVPRPGLGHDGHLVARDVLQSLGSVRVAAIGIGQIKEA